MGITRHTTKTLVAGWMGSDKPPTCLEVARKILYNKSDPLETKDPRVLQVLRLVVNELEEIRHELNKPVRAGFDLIGPGTKRWRPDMPAWWHGTTFDSELEKRKKEEAEIASIHEENAASALQLDSLKSERRPSQAPTPGPSCPACGKTIVNERDMIELALLMAPSWLCRGCFDHLVKNSKSRGDNKLANSRREEAEASARPTPGRKETAEERKDRAVSLLKLGTNPNRVARATGVSWASAKKWKEEIEKGKKA